MKADRLIQHQHILYLLSMKNKLCKQNYFHILNICTYQLLAFALLFLQKYALTLTIYLLLFYILTSAILLVEFLFHLIRVFCFSYLIPQYLIMGIIAIYIVSCSELKLNHKLNMHFKTLYKLLQRVLYKLLNSIYIIHRICCLLHTNIR